jgi:ribonuclease HII
MLELNFRLTLPRTDVKKTKALSTGSFTCSFTRRNDWISGDRMSAKFWHRLSHECDLWQQGLAWVAGVDEAGCGPLAGPVFAAAVIFPCSWLQCGLDKKLRGLNDSKQLSEEQRDKYYHVLTSHPEIRYAIASMDVETIDRINIRQAAWRAMEAALGQLEPKPQHVLVDGLKIKWLPYAQTNLIDGDARSYTIAAASVLAKVTRDRIMRDLDKEYPGYGFAEHKGYSTPQHYDAIERLGPSPIHRRSFAPFRPVELELDLFPSAESAEPLRPDPAGSSATPLQQSDPSGQL